MKFRLDERLKKDTIKLKDFGPFRCLLANDRRFPWIIVVPMFPSITEVYQLGDQTQKALAAFSSNVGRQMMEKFEGDSLNVAAIGNVVTQLHVHHVVRFQNDAAWPAPIWGYGTPEAYDDSSKSTRVADMLDCLDFTWHSPSG